MPRPRWDRPHGMDGNAGFDPVVRTRWRREAISVTPCLEKKLGHTILQASRMGQALPPERAYTIPVAGLGQHHGLAAHLRPPVDAFARLVVGALRRQAGEAPCGLDPKPSPLLTQSQKRPTQISTKNKSGSGDRANVAFYTSDEFINIDCFIIKSSFIVSMTKISRSLILAIFLYFIITNKLVKKFLNHIILIQICKIYDYLAANLTILDPRWVLTQVRFRLHGEGRPPDRSVLRISAETRTTAESRTIRIRSKEDT